PVRYCLGFSARQEFDEKREEWILRGRHAHSWCRVYIDGTPTEALMEDGSRGIVWSGGRWVDFDPTPPSWTTVEGGRLEWRQRVNDWIQKLREDFLLWRTRPDNIARVSWATGIIGALLIAYVAVRLWLSRTRTGVRRQPPKRRVGPAGAATPFHKLARRAEKLLGERPDGLAQTRWLMQLAGPLPDLEPGLRDAVHLQWKARYDPLGLEEAEEERLKEVCREVARGMRKGRAAVQRKTVEAGGT
ncbi:MAG: hypothetical protein HKO57_06175, partial [Akkermansiaceae bacterium]|nr:hypothetical protein [Akkermansiaceae bacterium]